MGRFNLPVIGSSGNWGAALNNNFNLIDIELSRMNGTINSLHSIIGGKTPYIKMDDDLYFVGFEETNNDQDDYIVKVYYYSRSPESIVGRENGPIDEDDDAKFVYNYTKRKWESPPIIGLGAYVLFYEKLETELEGVESLLPGEQDFERGDFAVVTEEFGSIYGDNYTSSVYKKFPALGEYYLPKENEGAPYDFILEPTNYVDWFLKAKVNEPKIIYPFPSIGLSSFNTFTFNQNSISVNGDAGTPGNSSVNTVTKIASVTLDFAAYEGSDIDDYTVVTNWRINNTPVFISNSIAKTSSLNSNNNTNIQVIISFDYSGIADDETLTCDVSISHKKDMAYTKIVSSGE